MSPTAARMSKVLDDLAADAADAARRFARRIQALDRLARLAETEQAATGEEQFPDLELAGTCRLGSTASGRELSNAQRYVETLPLTVAALGRGELYVHQAQTILRATENAAPAVARQAEHEVLTTGGADLCPADLRKKVKRAVLKAESDLDSDAVTERLVTARAKRRTWVRSEDDGMASIGCLAPAEHVRQWAKAMERLVLQEKAHDRAAGLWRSADQIRADLVAAMPGWLLAARAEAAGSRLAPQKDTLVNVFVPVTTVLEHNSDPGELEGYGPISAEHVRLLLPDARLRRACADAVSGRPLSLDDAVQPASGDVEVARQRLLAMLRPTVVTHSAEPQHDPSAALRRFVAVRSRRCDGPGCSVPASRCHDDHRVPYPAGPTAEWNLDPRSPRCHGAKHSGWSVRVNDDGSTTWTSPLGRTYRRPPAYDPPPVPSRGARLRPPRRIPTDAAPDADSDEPMTPLPEPMPSVVRIEWDEPDF